MAEVWEFLEYKKWMWGDNRDVPYHSIISSPARLPSILKSLKGVLYELGVKPDFSSQEEVLYRRQGDYSEGERNIITGVTRADILNALSMDGWEPVTDVGSDVVLFRRRFETPSKNSIGNFFEDYPVLTTEVLTISFSGIVERGGGFVTCIQAEYKPSGEGVAGRSKIELKREEVTELRTLLTNWDENSNPDNTPDVSGETLSLRLTGDFKSSSATVIMHNQKALDRGLALRPAQVVELRDLLTRWDENYRLFDVG